MANMKCEGVTITWIAPEEQIEQRDRHGFVPVCGYGSVQPERGEIGCIARIRGKPQLTRIPGIWSTPIEVLERIFIVAPEGER
jgi:hypothetical protein